MLPNIPPVSSMGLPQIDNVLLTVSQKSDISCLSSANGAVQDSGKRNQDESILKRGARPGPEGGPSSEGEGGGWDVANGELYQ